MDPIPVEQSDVPPIYALTSLFGNIISIVLSVAGLVLFIMLISSGIKFLTSGGDPKKVEAARGTLTSAIIGIVILVCSFLILKLISNVTGINLTTFNTYLDK